MKRDGWLDKFLQSEKITKLAKHIEASYVDQVRLIQEGKTLAKWSSVEDALQDFASRHGLTSKELSTLKRAASEKTAAGKIRTQEENIALADKEGLGSQALEFMGKAKNKHTQDSPSPFVISPDEAEELKKLKSDKENLKHDLNNNGIDDANEFVLSQQASRLLLLQKAGEGKILNLPVTDKPTSEQVQELLKEFTAESTERPYSIARLGFKFTSFQDTRPVENAPIKVTILNYVAHKPALADAIAVDLINQLNQELPLVRTPDMEWDGWLSFISKEYEKTKDPKLNMLRVELTKLHDLVTKGITLPFSREDKAVNPKEIPSIMKRFPASYRRKIIQLVAEGSLRHHLSKEYGVKHPIAFSSGYPIASFALMQSFSPFTESKPVFTDEAQKTLFEKQLADKATVRADGRKMIDPDSYKEILDSLQIQTSSKEVQRPLSSVKIGDEPIYVKNQANDSYQPKTYNLSAGAEVEDIENYLIDLSDDLMATMHGNPVLGYLQIEGKNVKVTLDDVLNRKVVVDGKEYEIRKDNKDRLDFTAQPNYGLAPRSSTTPWWSSFASQVGKTKQFGKPSPKQSPAPSTSSESPQSSSIDWTSLIKKQSTATYLHKFAAEVPQFMDSKGHPFTSEKDLKQALVSEMLEELQNDKEMVDLIVTKVMAWVDKLPEAKEQKTQAPLPTSEELPLAASSITRLKKIASPKVQAKITYILNSLRK